MPAVAPGLSLWGLRVADGGGGVEAYVAVGVAVGEDGDEDVAGVVVGVEVGEEEDDDVAAVGTEADHVVAGRPDLWWCLEVSGCLFVVLRAQDLGGRRRTAH